MKKLLLLITLTIVSFLAQAQEKIEITEKDYTNTQVEMADAFRADGKIYVLTSIICLILVGIIIYLVAIDRKVSKLEKHLSNRGN